MSEISEGDCMFDLCEKLPNYDSDQLGEDMANPVEEGGYLTLV